MTTPVGTGTISGKVLAAEGGPVRKAAVFLLWNGTPRSTATAITDGAGQFRFDALPPGDYDLRSSREGFGSAVFGATEGSLIGKPIRLASGEQRSGIVLTLVRAASIAGVVRDVDGEPLPGADVQVYKEGFPRGTRSLFPRMSARANDKGEYRISNLEPGKFYIAANHRQNLHMRGTGNSESVGYVRQFYGGATEWKQSTPVAVASGAQLRGIDFQLTETRMFPLRGRVVGVPDEVADAAEAMRSRRGSGGYAIAGGNAPQGHVMLQLRSATDLGDGQPFAGTGTTPPEYRFEFQPAPPGRHVITASVNVGEKLYVGMQEVDTSRDAGEITVALTPAVQLRGTLSVEGDGAPPVTSMTVTLTSGDTSGAFSGPRAFSAKADSEGKFAFPSVPPGAWDIGVNPPIRGGYVKAMRLGEQDVLTEEMLIGTETPPALNVVVSSRGARVEGEVDDELAKDRRLPVMLAPVGKFREVMSFYTTVMSDKGKFQAIGITPGKYVLFAFEPTATATDMRNPDLVDKLAELGTKLEIAEGAVIQARPKLIRAPQIEEALR